MLEEIIAYGHPNITAKHRTTLQVTKDEEITLRADCVIGVRADKSVRDLSQELKSHLLEGGSVSIGISVREMEFHLEAMGDPRLRLTHARDVVVRKSDFVDDRTLVIRSSAAARDLPREMVRAMRRADEVIVMEILF